MTIFNINKKTCKILIFETIIGVILFFLWLRFIDLEELVFYFERISFFWLFLSLLFLVLAFVLRTLRWYYLVLQVEKVSFLSIIHLNFIGSLTSFLVPMFAGGFLRAYLLKTKSKSSFSSFFSTVFLDKLADIFVPTFVFLILILPFFRTSWASEIFFVLFLFIILCSFLYFLIYKVDYYKKLLNFVCKITHSGFFYSKIEGRANDFFQASSLLKSNHRLIIIIFFLSLAAQIASGASIFFLLISFGVILPFWLVTFAVILVAASNLIPAPPGYIGSWELFGTLILVLFLGLDKNLAGSVSVFFHLLNTLFIIVGGLISVQILGFSGKKIFTSEDTME